MEKNLLLFCLQDWDKIGMSSFEENILGTFGTSGKIWFNKLPKIVEYLQKYWRLQGVHPVSAMTYHFVAKAYDAKRQPVFSKLDVMLPL